MLPVKKRFSLGEGMTPLVPVELDGERFLAKLEHLNPTGSFKDRGSATMLNHFAGLGVHEVVDNSSGNAGASIAAYAAAAGIKARIFVPAESAVESKKNHIRAYGGQIVECADAAGDAQSAAQHIAYASHAWSPWFALGQRTVAWETWEQLGERAPDAIATPAGHGGLFLGFYRGFEALQQAGLIDRMPRMIALQSAGVDPIVCGWERNLAAPPNIKSSPSVADGILIDKPARGKQILDALYATDGFALRVADAAIIEARARLAGRGFFVERTSAVTVAALPRIRQRLKPGATLVLAFSGSGLKDLA